MTIMNKVSSSRNTARECCNDYELAFNFTHVCWCITKKSNIIYPLAIFVRRGFVIEHQDDKTRAREAAYETINDCQGKAKEAISAQGDNVTPEFLSQTYDELMACVEGNVADKLQKVQEEVSFQANLRKSMGELIESYTCVDEGMKTSEAVSTSQWRDGTGKHRQVDVLLNLDTSRVHLIHDFISPEECEAITNAAQGRLQTASTADEIESLQGLRASYARIPVPGEGETGGDLIASVRRRVFEYANRVMSFKVAEDGQEDLMVTQYVGRGKDDPSPDRYLPHCDAKCDGSAHESGGRVATMIVYCKVAEMGGSTNFRNAGLHVVPVEGYATFFTYMGPDGSMDKGFTEHSGCPVFEGEKKIVTQWIRH